MITKQSHPTKNRFFPIFFIGLMGLNLNLSFPAHNAVDWVKLNGDKAATTMVKNFKAKGGALFASDQNSASNANQTTPPIQTTVPSASLASPPASPASPTDPQSSTASSSDHSQSQTAVASNKNQTQITAATIQPKISQSMILELNGVHAFESPYNYNYPIGLSKETSSRARDYSLLVLAFGALLVSGFVEVLLIAMRKMLSWLGGDQSIANE